MVPLDRDVLTMDDPTAYKELKVHKDPTAMFRAAKAIMQLQMIYGLIPRITGKGKAAEVRGGVRVRVGIRVRIRVRVTVTG